jgi:hypothetical protein
MSILIKFSKIWNVVGPTRRSNIVLFAGIVLVFPLFFIELNGKKEISRTLAVIKLN